MRIEYHRTLIADHVRNRAFFEALKAAIVPGETVVADIGTGTGLIGLMAAHLGARHVYMYETAAIGAVAERVVKANRARNCEVIACHSTDMIDPPKVDLVVSETLGNYAFEENIIATLADASARHLKPGGRIIPAHVAQFAAPVVTDKYHRELSVWNSAGSALGFDLDFSTPLTMTYNNAYVRSFEPADLLNGVASAIQWDEVAFPGRSSNRRGEATWRLPEAQTIYGFAIWWAATLIPAGIRLATGPADPRTHWEQLYLPVSEPIATRRGDTLAVSIRSRSSEDAGTHLRWIATASDGADRIQRREVHDLDKGYLP